MLTVRFRKLLEQGARSKILSIGCGNEDLFRCCQHTFLNL